MIKLKDFLVTDKFFAKSYNKSETIFESHDSSDSGICFILSGSVETSSNHQLDTENKKFYKQGDFLGLTSLFSSIRYTTAIAKEDHTKILFIDKECFENYLKEDRDFLTKFIDIILNSLESLPRENIKAPEKNIDIDEILGKGASLKFQSIRQQNLNIKKYAPSNSIKTIGNKENVFQHELFETNIYLLLDGSIQQFMLSSQGDVEPIIKLEKGSLFGFLRSANTQRHIQKARAVDGTATVILLTHELLNTIASKNVDLAYSIFLNLVLTVSLIKETMFVETLSV